LKFTAAIRPLRIKGDEVMAAVATDGLVHHLILLRLESLVEPEKFPYCRVFGQGSEA
jgi:hypothetical protein